MKRNKPSDMKEEFRKTSLYPILLCGILLIVIGVIMSIRHEVAIGRAGYHRLRAANGRAYITGPVCIWLGVAMSIFPAYQLIKKAFRK